MSQTRALGWRKRDRQRELGQGDRAADPLTAGLRALDSGKGVDRKMLNLACNPLR